MHSLLKKTGTSINFCCCLVLIMCLSLVSKHWGSSTFTNHFPHAVDSQVTVLNYVLFMPWNVIGNMKSAATQTLQNHTEVYLSVFLNKVKEQCMSSLSGINSCRQVTKAC
ncbi:hypothetical protein KIL84_013663 [Mauremys mutica]|uniref:Uncharacterized protein n=1 Tax=Mauremys mutica TaxID=74926 RepID=A0A9D3WXB6_9SAUR|nr:hypothetical protein KIL84_013663 [Mauremys mutica]